MLSKTRMLLAAVLLVSGSTWLAAPARADDRNPPTVIVNPIKLETWNRGSPYTTSAEWVFNVAPGSTPMAPNGPVAGTVPTYVGDFVPLTYGQYTNITGPVAIPSAGLILDNNGWKNPLSTSDATITFVIPNWIDVFPIKFLELQSVYYHPIEEQIGSTSPPLSVIGDKGGLQSTVERKGDQDYELGSLEKHYNFSYYTLQPNPDWEYVVMTVKPGYTISQVVIDTISIPEPATASLLLIAGAACLLRRRR
jgi:hypothetical protein